MSNKTLYGDVLITLVLIGLVVFLFVMNSIGGKCAMNPIKYIEDKHPDWDIIFMNNNIIIASNETVEEMENFDWLGNINDG